MTGKVFYSQHGEDALLLQIFKKPGYYVELGAVDGVHYSNTYSLELNGWTGLLIEAHPDHFAKLAKNRPNSISIHAAVADREGIIPFYATPRGSLSTFDKDQRDYFIKNRSEVTADSYTEHQVRAASTTTLLDEARAPKIIDIMSIDIEGAELPALMGLDFEAYDVRVLIIEKDLARSKQDIEMQIESLLISKGYHVARRIGANDFWVKDKVLGQAINAASFDVELAKGGRVCMKAGQSSKKRGLFKRLSNSYKKRFG